MSYGSSRSRGVRFFAQAVCEQMEARWLLADVIGSTQKTYNLLPRRGEAGDGQGNKQSVIEQAVLPFSTSTFGRLETAYTIGAFDHDFDQPGAAFAMTFALWKDTNANETLDTADGKISNLGTSANTELAAGKYLFVITPTGGTNNTTANVQVKLRSNAVSAAKIQMQGSGKTISDGDASPSVEDFTDFGTVPVGVINVDRTFVVRNTGGSALSLGPITVPAGFVVKAGLPPSLAAGASASFTIALGTATAAVRSGLVGFTTNDPSVGSFSYSITGTVDADALPGRAGLRRLRINGTSGADNIVLTQNASRIIFAVNGNPYSVLKSKITKGISVDAFSGNDVVSVDAGITLPVLIVGNTGNDTLIGGGGADTLIGLAGDDVLRGGGGADSIDGGDGGDTADYAERAVGVTVTLDGLANDGIVGEKDLITATTENILGGAGNDTLSGSNGANFINGLGGKDFILGLGGDDLLRGGSGNDTLRPGTGIDTLIGEAGSDMADYSERNAAVFLTNDDVANDGVAGEKDNINADIEKLAGGSAADIIELFGSGGIGYGFGGTDTLRGSDGNDALFGGDGDDILTGFGGNDYMEGNAGEDQLYGLVGNDTLAGGIGNDSLDGGITNDSLLGEAGDDTLIGFAGNDTGRGGEGNDLLFGERFSFRGVGSDVLYGDGGNDTLGADDDDDELADFFDGGTGTDTVALITAGDTILNVP